MAEKVDYATLKKGGFMRQKQKNNFSLRLAVVGGYLTAENLIKIAEVAKEYGDGHVHLTSRQGVEIPFIKLKDIDAVRETIENGMSADFVVIDLRTVWEKLGEITGDTVGEDIIDEIFSRFCIGK